MRTTTDTARRPQYTKGAARREGILAEAEKLFTELGYNQPTMIDIAERCGISRGGLLRYFPTKEALLIAVLEERGIAGRGHVGPKHSGSTVSGPVDEEAPTPGIQVPDLWALWKGKGEAADAFLDQRVAEVGLGRALLDLMEANLADRAYLELFVPLSAEAFNPAHPAHGFFTNHYKAVTEWLVEQLGAATSLPGIPSDLVSSRHAEINEVSASIIAVMDGLQARYLYKSDFEAIGAFRTFLRSVGLMP